jgi:hypothetical protein
MDRDRNSVSYAFHITLLKSTLYMAVPLGIKNHSAIRAGLYIHRNLVSYAFHVTLLKSTLYMAVPLETN